jgi:hypothetical protein
MLECQSSFSLATSCEKIDPCSLQRKQWENEIHADPVRVNYGNGHGTMFLEEHTYSDFLRHLISDCGWDELNTILQGLKNYDSSQLQEII